MAPRKLPALPTPPPDLAGRPLPLRFFAGTLYRIHRLSHSPAHWGRGGGNRFDDPEAGTLREEPGGTSRAQAPAEPPQAHALGEPPRLAFGVLYAAERFDGAFIETFGDLTPHLVSAESLRARGVALLTTRRPLALVDLAGPGLAQLGLDARISTADHAVSQRWSRALWAHPRTVDGIWYAARHDSDQRSVALFDRAASAVRLAAAGSLLDTRNLPLTANAVDRYGFALLP